MRGTPLRTPNTTAAAPEQPAQARLADDSPTHPPAATPRPPLTWTFCSTVACYLTTILPAVTRELRGWRRHADRIPDPVLRDVALKALSKRGNMEGAALFAVLAPRRHRRATVRALVAFQAAYNYLDTLAEQPAEQPDTSPQARARALHEALLVALKLPRAHTDYYRGYPNREDDGFLHALIDTCRTALATLPSRELIRGPAVTLAEGVVAFQSRNLTERQGGHEQLEQWALKLNPPASTSRWFHIAGAAGSSLGVHALIAAAADPRLDAQHAAAIQAAYFPSICALHSQLDSLVDIDEDERAGQRNLLSYHTSPEHAASAIRTLAHQATDAAATLHEQPRHQVILTAMVSYYLSSPEAHTARAAGAADAVAGAAGPLVKPALVLFAMRRLAGRLTHGGYR